MVSVTDSLAPNAPVIQQRGRPRALMYEGATISPILRLSCGASERKKMGITRTCP